MRHGKPTLAHWLSLPPKVCVACERRLPRTEFSIGHGKCKTCYRGHRTTVPGGRAPEPTGPDHMAAAQAELYPGRRYTQLTRDECRAVRWRALELLAAATTAAGAAA